MARSTRSEGCFLPLPCRREWIEREALSGAASCEPQDHPSFVTAFGRATCSHKGEGRRTERCHIALPILPATLFAGSPSIVALTNPPITAVTIGASPPIPRRRHPPEACRPSVSANSNVIPLPTGLDYLLQSPHGNMMNPASCSPYSDHCKFADRITEVQQAMNSYSKQAISRLHSPYRVRK